jgi:AcrR family transcriptional regulator
MEGRRAAATEANRKAIVAAARALLVTRRWQDFTVDAVARTSFSTTPTT